MKKNQYETPLTELMFVRFEQNILSELATNKPDDNDMDVETWDEWDS